jgi:angiopoietin 2/ficolin
LTKDDNYQLRVDLQDWEDIKKYALYNIFNVGDETTKYQLSVGDYSGDEQLQTSRKKIVQT